MFLLVPAYPGCHGPRAVKQLCLCACVRVFLLSTVDDDVDDIATVHGNADENNAVFQPQT